MEKDYVKQVVTERLQDIFKQNYDEYLASPENVGYLIPVTLKIIYTLKRNICQLLNLQA